MLFQLPALAGFLCQKVSMDQEFINRLHDTTERHSEEIAKLRESDIRTRETIEHHARLLATLDDSMDALKIAIGNVATRRDFIELKGVIKEQYESSLRAAHRSIPAKPAFVVVLGMLAVAVLGLVISLAAHA
jgi:membrane-bound ClpP family serine protease